MQELKGKQRIKQKNEKTIREKKWSQISKEKRENQFQSIQEKRDRKI